MPDACPRLTGMIGHLLYEYSIMDFLSMISICFLGALFKKEDMFRMVMGINRV